MRGEISTQKFQKNKIPYWTNYQTPPVLDFLQFFLEGRIIYCKTFLAKKFLRGGRIIKVQIYLYFKENFSIKKFFYKGTDNLFQNFFGLKKIF